MRHFLLIGLVILAGCQQGERPDEPSAQPTSTAPGPNQISLPKTVPLPEIFGKPQSRPAGPSGFWKWYSPFDPTLEYVLRLEVDGQRVTGGLAGRKTKETPIYDAYYRDGELTFSVAREKGVYKYTGRVQGDTIRGSIEHDFGNGPRRRDWEATREKP